jgi:NAD(P)-dependent dehydrogenase (short-subunit alcohol dehydrogenase family)
MKSIVITGSTRGIGYGLADAFLARGCQVMVSGRGTIIGTSEDPAVPLTPAERGRGSAAVDQAVAELSQKHGAANVSGQPCDVTDYAQVQALWDAAIAHFGKVDIWINNAGIGNTLTPFWELVPEKMQQVVNTNILGVMYGCKVALTGMLAQGYGSLYNMEGYGSRDSGRIVSGLALYGTTKAALAFLDTSLIEEAKGKSILVGRLMPGMVTTDLLLNQRTGDPAEWERSKRIFNILADRVETVTPWLADQILANTKHGARISWTNGMKIMMRFLTAPFVKRNVID